MAENAVPAGSSPAAASPLLPAGWTVQQTVNEGNRTIYQLFDAAGEYIVSATSEAALLKRAEKRGLLPSA